jgi:hypothetical protein
MTKDKNTIQLKKKKILSFVTRVDLEVIVLSEIKPGTEK